MENFDVYFEQVICRGCGAVSTRNLDNGWFTCIWCEETQRHQPRKPKGDGKNERR